MSRVPAIKSRARPLSEVERLLVEAQGIAKREDEPILVYLLETALDEARAARVRKDSSISPGA